MTDYEKKVRTYSHFDFNLEIKRVHDYLDYLVSTGREQKRIDATQRRADILAKIAAERA